MAERADQQHKEWDHASRTVVARPRAARRRRIHYYLLTAFGESNTAVTPPATSATISGLSPGQTVTFLVTAYDAAFNSTNSTQLTVTTVADSTGPTAPSGLEVRGVTASTVELFWTNGTDTAGPPRHEVLVNGVVSPNVLSNRAPGSPRSWAEGGWVRQLEPGTTYTFTVRAVDGSGNVSAASAPVTATTGPSTDTVAPTTPTLTAASSGGTSVCPEELELRWTGSTDDVEAPATIDYEVRINGALNDVFAGVHDVKWIVYSEVFGPNVVTIVAVDRAGNASAPSNARTVDVNWGSDCPV